MENVTFSTIFSKLNISKRKRHFKFISVLVVLGILLQYLVIPPIVEASSPTATFTPYSTNGGWTNHYVGVSIHPSASGGVAYSQIRTTDNNGAAWSSWSNAFNGDGGTGFLADGQHQVEAYVEDNSGNHSYIYSGWYNIDSTPPTATFTPYSTNGGWTNQYVGVSIHPSDALSGVAYSQFRTTDDDGVTWSSWSNAFNGDGGTGFLADGQHQVEAYVEDNSGNHSYIYSGWYNIDRPLIKTNANINVNSSLNRNSVVSYINSYATSRNPSYRDLGWDCTDFVSQCLGDVYGGELTQLYDSWEYQIPFYTQSNDNYWYYFKLMGSLSSTWSNAERFRNHWGGTSGNVPMYAYKYIEYSSPQEALNDFDDLYIELWQGDVIQVINDSGLAHHSMIVQSFSSNGDIIYAQHQDDLKGLSLRDSLVRWCSNPSEESKVDFILIKHGFY